MRIHVQLWSALILLSACPSWIVPNPLDSSEVDTDGDTDTDTDSDADADLLLQRDLFLAEGADYVSATFQSPGGGGWVHIELSSETLEVMTGLVATSGATPCQLEVPHYGYGTVHFYNDGYLRLVDAGNASLSVFGTAPTEGATIHARVALTSDLPFDSDEPCTLDGDNCTCTSACNCDTRL